MSDFDARKNVELSGYGREFAEIYHTFRRAPPAELFDLLVQLAGGGRPRLVVDLGSGTGLSSFPWAERAERVVGVEPNPVMRRLGAARLRDSAALKGVEFREGFGHETGLDDGGADLVTCSQALHWMEPEPTLAEVARILRPGGVFAAYDYDWPPAVHWELEQLFREVQRRTYETSVERGLEREIREWPKHEHLARMHGSSRFRYVREVALHATEIGNAERFIGSTLSQSHVCHTLDRGVREDEIGFDELRSLAERVLGEEGLPWYWTYRVRIGVK